MSVVQFILETLGAGVGRGMLYSNGTQVNFGNTAAGSIGTNFAIQAQNTGWTTVNSSGTGGIEFKHEDNERMVMTSVGRLGIGTDIPATKLEVARLDSASDVNNLLRLSSQITTLGNGPSMEFYVKQAVGGYERLTAAIEGELIEISGGNGSGNLVFSTTNTSGTTFEEIMRLGPSEGSGTLDAVVVISKSVGIGYKTSNFHADTHSLKVSGSSYFNSAVYLNNALYDVNNLPGTVGQVLTSNVSAVNLDRSKSRHRQLEFKWY